MCCYSGDIAILCDLVLPLTTFDILSLFCILNVLTIRWHGEFLNLVLSVLCSINLLYLFPRFGKFSAIILMNIFYMLLLVPFLLCPWFKGLVFIVSPMSCLFYSYFLIAFPYHCLNILTHLPCLQSLIFCLLLDLVYWQGFNLVSYLAYWAIDFISRISI
jgi:hypothetical protein